METLQKPLTLSAFEITREMLTLVIGALISGSLAAMAAGLLVVALVVLGA